MKAPNSKYIILILLLFSINLFLSGCKDEGSVTDTIVDTPPSAKFAVISDPHLFDPSLGISGTAFETYLAQDRKMIAESDEIFKSFSSSLGSENVQFLLICGDLTKDGELSSHQKLASYLKSIESSGKKVYVIPGNHDVLNPESYSYSGGSQTKVSNVSPETFKQIYSDFGYSEAIDKDTASLSYVVEPVQGLWILAMDPCRYKENTTHSVTGGKFSASTLQWIKDKLTEAQNKKKMVFGMAHHGILEHYSIQKQFFAEYVIEDNSNISDIFMTNKMNVVFTGHYHANDITGKQNSNSFLYDIETGSLVTSPSPYRIVDLNSEGKLKIVTKLINQINYNTNGKSFTEYSKLYLEGGMLPITTYYLMDNFKISQQQAASAAPLFVNAFVAHYAGDETPSAQTLGTLNALMNSGDQNSIFMGTFLTSLWTDLAPKDNSVTIDLKTGSITATR